MRLITSLKPIIRKGMNITSKTNTNLRTNTLFSTHIHSQNRAVAMKLISIVWFSCALVT